MKRLHFLLLLSILPFLSTGCFRYSFYAGSIPDDVKTIFIPFFPDQSRSGLSNLSDLLNEALINRFVNQSRLVLARSEESADVVLDGIITSFRNAPFSIAGNEQATLNRVEIVVKASYKYAREDKPEWDKSFNGFEQYDPTQDPIEGENQAAILALEQIARKMFDDSLGMW